MIKKAKIHNLGSIMEIIDLTIKEMGSYNNTQWDKNYPQSNDFMIDIQKGDLYIKSTGKDIKGFICVNYIEPIEYNGLNWRSNQKCMVIHRMAVHPKYRNQGIGSIFMKFADELAIENNVNYLKTDTYSINTKMNSLFNKSEFKFIGEMNFLGKEKPFYCYDKIIINK